MALEELPQKVYLTVFFEPLNITEIGMRIYKKKKQTYKPLMDRKTGAIQRSIQRGWIQQVWIEYSKGEKPHGYEVSKYYYADIYPIIEEIDKELAKRNKKLEPEEKDKLEELLDSDSFRSFMGIVSDKLDYKKNIDTFDIVMETLSILGAFALISKNYGVYLFKKYKKHLPKKYKKIDMSRLGKKEFTEFEKDAVKKGFTFNKLLEESFDLLYQLIPSRIEMVSSKDVSRIKDLGIEVMSLSPELCDKLSVLASYYSDLFLSLIGMSFLVPEKTNVKVRTELSEKNARLIEYIKKKGFRLPKLKNL